MTPLTVTITGRRPTTVNASRRMHPHERAVDDKWWRQMAWAQALPTGQRAVYLMSERSAYDAPVTIDATPLYKNHRALPDPGGTYPSVKAAIDGIVDAGILAGDTHQHIAAITLHAPRVGGVEGLELVIREA